MAGSGQALDRDRAFPILGGDRQPPCDRCEHVQIRTAERFAAAAVEHHQLVAGHRHERGRSQPEFGECRRHIRVAGFERGSDRRVASRAASAAAWPRVQPCVNDGSSSARPLAVVTRKRSLDHADHAHDIGVEHLGQHVQRGAEQFVRSRWAAQHGQQPDEATGVAIRVSGRRLWHRPVARSVARCRPAPLRSHPPHSAIAATVAL